MLLGYFYNFIAILLVVTVHELTKAYLSYSFGDTALKNDGSLSLNPFKHIDILGLILYMFYGYGWGKPVKTSPFLYKNRQVQRVLVYAIPFAVLLILGFVANILQKITSLDIFMSISIISYKTFLINLLPIEPFNMNKILKAILPPNSSMSLSRNDNILQIIFVFLLLFGIVGSILNPLIALMYI